MTNPKPTASKKNAAQKSTGKKRTAKTPKEPQAVDWKGLRKPPPLDSDLAVSINDFESRPIAWLWFGRIPLGKLTILDGDPDMGKSVIANADIAARVTTGGQMPDGSDGLGQPRAVVLVVAEDDIGDTVKPRLIEAGANLDYIYLIPVERNSKGHLIPLTIPNGLERLKKAIKKVGAALVVIDPIAAFLDESVNSHNDASTRKALGPLKELAEETGAAFVMIRHLNKSGDAKALYRGGGSIAFSGAARSGLMVERMPDDAEWKALAQVKGNLSRKVKTMTYKIVSALDLNPEAEFDVAVTVWGEPSDLTADQLFEKQDARKRSPERDRACAFLVEVLRDNPTPALDVLAQAADAGLSATTVRKAADHMNVKREPVRRPETKKVDHWVWSLPKGLKSWTA